MEINKKAKLSEKNNNELKKEKQSKIPIFNLKTSSSMCLFSLCEDIINSKIGRNIMQKSRESTIIFSVLIILFSYFFL